MLNAFDHENDMMMESNIALLTRRRIRRGGKE